jgi:hypothetical protein
MWCLNFVFFETETRNERDVEKLHKYIYMHKEFHTMLMLRRVHKIAKSDY